MKKKVLIADDDIEIIGCLTQIAIDEDYEVTSTQTPEVAIELGKTEHFNLILCDFTFKNSSLNGDNIIESIFSETKARNHIYLTTSHAEHRIEDQLSKLRTLAAARGQFFQYCYKGDGFIEITNLLKNFCEDTATKKIMVG